MTWIDLEATGTNHDALLRYLSGSATKKLRILRCPRGCAHELAADDILHGVKGRKGLELNKEDGWMGNLIQVIDEAPQDELAELRRRGAEVAAEPPPGEGAPKLDVKEKEEDKPGRKAKKKKKKDKERKRKAEDMGPEGEDRVPLDGSRPKLANPRIRKPFSPGLA